MLIAKLLARAFPFYSSRGAQAALVAGGAAGGIIGSDIINLDWLRRESFKIAPGSDAVALEEAARTVARMLNLSGDEVLWPRTRTGDPIAPKYLTIDLGRGRAWYHTKYYSKKSVSGARKAARRIPSRVVPASR